MNKSFSKDLKRSYNLYTSYVKHVKNYENIPFVIVIPKSDLDLFANYFSNFKVKPIFMTEEDVLTQCQEPLVSIIDGGWSQQVIKLCFGLTNFARYYFIIDSDIYFTKDVDIEDDILNKYKNIPFFIVSERCISDKEIEEDKKKDFYILNGQGTKISYFGVKSLVKSILGSSDSCYRGYVLGFQIFDSEVIYALRKHVKDRGVSNFTHLIRLVPFEFQWYGEYLSNIGQLEPANPIFSYYDPGVGKAFCRSEDASEDKNAYGIWFQSID